MLQAEQDAFCKVLDMAAEAERSCLLQLELLCQNVMSNADEQMSSPLAHVEGLGFQRQDSLLHLQLSRILQGPLLPENEHHNASAEAQQQLEEARAAKAPDAEQYLLEQVLECPAQCDALTQKDPCTDGHQ